MLPGEDEEEESGPLTLQVRDDKYLPCTLVQGTPVWLACAGSSPRSSPLVFFVKRRVWAGAGDGGDESAVVPDEDEDANEDEEEQQEGEEDEEETDAQETLKTIRSLVLAHSGSDDTGLARHVAAVLAQTRGRSDDARVLAVRVQTLLWCVARAAADDGDDDSDDGCVLPAPAAMADVARLLARPSRAVPASLRTETRTALAHALRRAAPALAAFLATGVLPRAPSAAARVASLLAYAGVPQRDRLDALRAACAGIGATGAHRSSGRAAALVAATLPHAPPDTRACVLTLLLRLLAAPGDA